MLNNYSKICQRTTIILLTIMVYGLLNICLFAFQVKAAPIQPPKLNFTYNNSGNCVAEPMPKPSQAIDRPSAPMPECCLTQNRNFNAVVNTTNDKPAPTFAGLIILALSNQNFENYFTYYTSRLTYPPPAALALASTVIRE